MLNAKKRFEEFLEVDLEVSEFIRVLRLARTPDLNEFSWVGAISAAGIIITGLLGVILFEIVSLFPQ